MTLKDKIIKQEPIGKIFLSVEEKGLAYNIYKVNVDSLKLNDLNGRFRASSHDFNSDFRDGLEESVKEEFIASEKEGQFNKLRKAVQKDGQVDPLVLNQDGVVIDGNTRLTILRQLGEQEASVIFLNGDYTEASDIERMETALQFMRPDKVQYTPNNREIKMANIFADEVKRGKSPTAAKKYVSDVMGVQISDVTFALFKEKVINDVFERLDRNFKYKWFEKTSEQFKGMMNLMNKTIKLKSSLDDSWYMESEELKQETIEKFEDATVIFLLTKPRAVGGTREFFKARGKFNVISNKEYFDDYINYVSKLDLEELINRYLKEQPIYEFSMNSNDFMTKRTKEMSNGSLTVNTGKQKTNNDISIKSSYVNERKMVIKREVLPDMDLALTYLNSAKKFIGKVNRMKLSEDSLKRIEEIMVLLNTLGK